MSLLHNVFELNRFGSDGCLSETAQFSRSHAAFVIFFYAYHVLLAIQAKHHFKLPKNSLSINSNRPCRFAITSEDCA